MRHYGRLGVVYRNSADWRRQDGMKKKQKQIYTFSKGGPQGHGCCYESDSTTDGVFRIDWKNCTQSEKLEVGGGGTSDALSFEAQVHCWGNMKICAVSRATRRPFCDDLMSVVRYEGNLILTYLGNELT